MSTEIVILLMSIYILIASLVAAFTAEGIKESQRKREWDTIMTGWLLGIVWPFTLAVAALVCLVAGIIVLFQKD